MDMTKYSKIKHKAVVNLMLLLMLSVFLCGCGGTETMGDAEKNTANSSAVKIECRITVEDYCDAVTVQIPEGSTVYEALNETGADVSARKSAYGLYIEGIDGRFEFDEGPTSGWVYTVNGERTSSSCDKFEVKSGDEIVWSYVDEL